jgi:quinol monooxygenase YgiN
MASIVIHHTVKDYSAWRPIYDEHEKSRTSAGITNAKVFRRAEDPNELVVLADVADVAKAGSWMSSDDLKSAMQKAGVTGPPKIHIIT